MGYSREFSRKDYLLIFVPAVRSLTSEEQSFDPCLALRRLAMQDKILSYLDGYAMWALNYLGVPFNRVNELLVLVATLIIVVFFLGLLWTIADELDWYLWSLSAKKAKEKVQEPRRKRLSLFGFLSNALSSALAVLGRALLVVSRSFGFLARLFALTSLDVVNYGGTAIGFLWNLSRGARIKSYLIHEADRMVKGMAVVVLMTALLTISFGVWLVYLQLGESLFSMLREGAVWLNFALYVLLAVLTIPPTATWVVKEVFFLLGKAFVYSSAWFFVEPSAQESGMASGEGETEVKKVTALDLEGIYFRYPVIVSLKATEGGADGTLVIPKHGQVPHYLRIGDQWYELEMLASLDKGTLRRFEVEMANGIFVEEDEELSPEEAMKRPPKKIRRQIHSPGHFGWNYGVWELVARHSFAASINEGSLSSFPNGKGAVDFLFAKEVGQLICVEHRLDPFNPRSNGSGIMHFARPLSFGEVSESLGDDVVEKLPLPEVVTT